MEFGSLVIKRRVIVPESVSITVDAIKMVSSEGPEPCGRRAIASSKSAMNVETSRGDFRRFTRLSAIGFLRHSLRGSEYEHENKLPKHTRHFTPMRNRRACSERVVAYSAVTL